MYQDSEHLHVTILEKVKDIIANQTPTPSFYPSYLCPAVFQDSRVLLNWLTWVSEDPSHVCLQHRVDSGTSQCSG